MTVITVAASEHTIQPAKNWDDFAARTTEQVRAANAELLVFAEYGSMGLVTALPEQERTTLAAQLAGMQQFAEQYCALFCQLAQQFQTWIVAPTFPFAIASEDITPQRYVNRAWITGPRGELFFQDKLHMTRFEREQFDITAGDALRVIDAGHFRFAVAICYDSEFPQQVHALVAAGAQIIAVPSCTDAEHGFNRVRISAQARALENQCFVVQAPLVGEAPWCEAIDINIGTAGIFSPVDRGFPADGILANGADNTGWAIARCDLTAMQEVRNDGQVFNLRDWQQPIPLITTDS
jgi:predicted amidohydrolase